MCEDFVTEAACNGLFLHMTETEGESLEFCFRKILKGTVHSGRDVSVSWMRLAGYSQAN